MTQAQWPMQEATVGVVGWLTDPETLADKGLEFPTAPDGEEIPIPDHCQLCRRFVDAVQGIAFSPVPKQEWLDIIPATFMLAHHGRFLYTRDKAKWVLQTLRCWGWPDMVLYQVANVLVDVGGLE